MKENLSQPAPAPAGGREAKRTAAVILEVLAGTRSPPQAAQAIAVSLPRYYQLETRAIAGLVTACEPRPRGRRRGPLDEGTALKAENERLRQELTRQQTLVRLAQRNMGVSPPAANPKAKRKRKPTARALVIAERLHAAASVAEPSAAV
jgi:hypothetical protein